MTFAIVQSAAAGTVASTHTSRGVSLPAGATAGNLLLAGIVVDKSAGSFTLPSDWTRVDADVVGASVSVMLVYLVAAGGETTITFTWATGQPSSAAFIAELSGVTATGLLADTSTSGNATVASLAFGPVAATGAGGALALVGIDSQSVLTDRATEPAWTNGFATLLNTSNTPADANAVGWSAATLTVAGAGDISTTASWTGGSDQCAGFLVYLPASGGATYNDAGQGTAAAAGAGADALVAADGGQGAAVASAGGAEALIAADGGQGTATAAAGGAEALVMADTGGGLIAASGGGFDEWVVPSQGEPAGATLVARSPRAVVIAASPAATLAPAALPTATISPRSPRGLLTPRSPAGTLTPSA